MSVSRVCYASREDVQRAPDFRTTAQGSRQIDRAIQSASDLIEAELHRVFYPRDTSYLFDWNELLNQWTLPLKQWDLISLTQLESPPGTVIPLVNVLLYPPNRKPGWSYSQIQLNRASTSAFAIGTTPQQAIKASGTWGFTADTDPAVSIAAAI